MSCNSARAYVGRLAPSPTGALHLGNARTFMLAYLRARSLGGKVILRMEDLDHPRDKPGAAAAAIADLRWLGFDWDEEYMQSTRREHYRSALRQLLAARRIYPCVCSRKDVEHAQSAPHAGEQLHYPGTCRDRFRSWDEAAALLATEDHPRLPCWRFRVEPGTKVEFEDVFAGHQEMQVDAVLGDFPVARDPDGAGYTLAVVVDDAAMGVSEVVRGDDLLEATAAQLLLYRALGLKPPQFCHVPLVTGADGRRLAKRHGDTRIAAYRAAGRKPEEVIAFLARSCGFDCPRPMRLRDLIAGFKLEAVPRKSFTLQASNCI